MAWFSYLTFLLSVAIVCICSADKEPTVCITTLIRNKEHTLPYFLGALDRLKYPKDKILLWMILDHSVDRSQEIVDLWVSQARPRYHQINYAVYPEPKTYTNQMSDVDWPEERMERVISLKMSAMQYAEEANADYLFYLDADAILMNPDVLTYLISLDKPVIAPMLNSTALYSNFWAGMDERGYYKRVEEYKPIRNRHVEGVFEVPMINSAVLIDLKAQGTEMLTFKRSNLPDAPHDDIIIFALSAKNNDIPLHIVNTEFFGYIPIPRDPDQSLEDEVTHWRELVTSRTVLFNEVFIPEPFSYDALPTTKLGFDEIYVVNLLRRTDRAEKMKRLLRIFNIGYEHFAAVDGKNLNASYLSQLGVKMLEGYEDPYYKRPLKMGEIGCFLSHYFIWDDMVKKGYKRILIMEDDAYLEPTFNEDMQIALADADKIVPNWDLMFVGRKILNWNDEKYVDGSTHLVYPGYSHWTVSYALTLSGAQKLLADRPLAQMVAVDEYIPIKYNKNSNEHWLYQFKHRDVIALSVNPLLIHPQLYTNQEGHYSDTEASVTIDAVVKDSESLVKPGPSDESFARGEL